MVQHINSLGCGEVIVCVGVGHVNALKGRFIGEEEAIVEGVARIDMVTEHDMRSWKESTAAGPIHRAVRRSALCSEGWCCHGQRFQRRSQHHAAANRVSQLNVVADGDIVSHRLEDLVEVAGRSQKTSLHQAVENVSLGLRNPFPLRLQGAQILVLIALILYVVDFDRLVVRFMRRQLEAVAPDICLRLEGNRMLVALLRLFDVDADREPEARLQVFAPAIEVEVVGAIVVAIAAGVGAIEADNVAVLVFNPDAAVKRPLPVPGLGCTSKTRVRTEPRKSRRTYEKS